MDAFHRADRLQGVLLFNSCAALVDGDMALGVKGVTGCRDIMRGASQPALHISTTSAARQFDRKTGGEHGLAVSAPLEMCPGRSRVRRGRRLLFQSAEPVPVCGIRCRAEQVCELGAVFEEKRVVRVHCSPARDQHVVVVPVLFIEVRHELVCASEVRAGKKLGQVVLGLAVHLDLPAGNLLPESEAKALIFAGVLLDVAPDGDGRRDNVRGQDLDRDGELVTELPHDLLSVLGENWRGDGDVLFAIPRLDEPAAVGGAVLQQVRHRRERLKHRLVRENPHRPPATPRYGALLISLPAR